MELKIVCGCGQKYKFDVEPIGGQMPMRVTCPSCGVDGTDNANQMLSGHFPSAIPPVAPAPAVSSGLRISRAAPPSLAADAAPVPITAPRAIAPIAPAASAGVKAASKDFNMGLGILGAFIGAAIGGGLMYAFFEWAGFRFPLTGVGIGALTGYGARLMGRGTDTTLGYIAGALALASIGGVFFLIYGGFPMLSIISVVICVGVAYRLASE